jgi:hypothetical protein
MGLRHIVTIAAVALVLAAGLFFVLQPGGGGRQGGGPEAYPYAVQRFENQGQEHLPPGAQYDAYNSNPPASGPHAPNFAPWGVSGAVIPKEVAVHNMEHAGVVVWYNCGAGPEPLGEDECAELRDGLSAVVQQALADGKSVLMTPYPDMDHRIALTAWQHLDTLDSFDGERVRAFIDAFECYTDLEGFCR